MGTATDHQLPLEQLRQVRIDKLKKIKELGIDPFVSKLTFSRVLVKEAREQSPDAVVAVAGRLMSIRSFGKLSFGDVVDETGKIQVSWTVAELPEISQKLLELLDMGDFIEVTGTLFTTHTGELTIKVSDFHILTKSIRPLPSTHFGLKDEEERYRQRYVDLILNPELKDLFRKKSIFWSSMREFLIKKGFLEVETPVLENTAGGADANPFVTHHNALDIDVYLRISMGELWQKRLMVAGFDKTFEIGRQFRNEGMSKEHLQDYTQMEFYMGYANYEETMRLVEEMYKYVIQSAFGTSHFTIGKHTVDIDTTWERIDYATTIKEHYGIDFSTVTREELQKKLKELKVQFDPLDEKGRLVDYLWKTIRKDIAGPAFLVGHPVEVSPLAKRIPENAQFVERYQVIIAGTEVGNGYSELNDPIDQAERFNAQQQMRDKGDEEAQMNDSDFVRALEYGMPPVSGFGISERLFAVMADKPVRECVLFPLLRPEQVQEK